MVIHSPSNKIKRVAARSLPTNIKKRQQAPWLPANYHCLPTGRYKVGPPILDVTSNWEQTSNEAAAPHASPPSKLLANGVYSIIEWHIYSDIGYSLALYLVPDFGLFKVAGAGQPTHT